MRMQEPFLYSSTPHVVCLLILPHNIAIRNKVILDTIIFLFPCVEQYYYGLSEVIYFQFNVSMDIEVSYFLDQGTLQSGTVSLFIDGNETERLRNVNEPTVAFPVTLLRNATIRFKTQHGSNTVWSYSISSIGKDTCCIASLWASCLCVYIKLHCVTETSY